MLPVDRITVRFLEFRECRTQFNVTKTSDMIAPRKKLWSTPDEVMLKAMALLELTEEDTLYDIGCGDGRFLIQCCQQTRVLRAVGVEIDAERAGAANMHIHKEIGISEDRLNIICGNALEQDYSTATKIFLYLTERGLRLIYPIIMNKMTHPVTIVTYMAPFQANCPVAPTVHCRVKTTVHPIGEWPLYLYHFDPTIAVPQVPATVVEPIPTPASTPMHDVAVDPPAEVNVSSTSTVFNT